MKSYESISDVVIAKFIDGKISISLSFLGTLFLLFKQTHWGLLALQAPIDAFSRLTANSENHLLLIVQLLAFLSTLLFPLFALLVSFFAIHLITIILIMLFVKSAVFIYCLVKSPPLTLTRLLSYEIWQEGQYANLRDLSKTKNVFDQRIVNKIGRLENLYLDYLTKTETVDYLEAYLKLQTEKYQKKLKTSSKALNWALRTLPFAIVGFTSGCDHGIADEIYCDACASDQIKTHQYFQDFLNRYRSEQNQARSSEQKKHRSPIKDSDLSILNISEPFTLAELKQKRNKALKLSHPDLTHGQAKDVKKYAEQKTQEILQAYSRLEIIAKR